jgi:hypothetical protein
LSLAALGLFVLLLVVVVVVVLAGPPFPRASAQVLGPSSTGTGCPSLSTGVAPGIEQAPVASQVTASCPLALVAKVTMSSAAGSATKLALSLATILLLFMISP